MSREQRDMAPRRHTEILGRLMDEHPNLWVDISWSVLYDYYFSDATRRPFLRRLPERLFRTRTDRHRHRRQRRHRLFAIRTGALDTNSYINQFLDDDAFRDIALGQSYFDLMTLDDQAPLICE